MYTDKSVQFLLSNLGGNCLVPSLNINELNQALLWATYHRVAPLFSRNLLDIETNLLPETIATSLNKTLEHTCIKNLLLFQELNKVLTLLKQEGVLAIPYKGLILAQLAYGTINYRCFGDLDLLLDKKDIPRAAAILKQHGYSDESAPTQYAAYLKSHHELNLNYYNPQLNICFHLELHWRVIHQKLGRSIAIGDIIDMSLVQKVNNSLILIPSNEDHLLMICLHHGIKDCWRSLRHLTDLAYFIKNHILDWSYILSRASALGIKRTLFVGLILAHKLLDLNYPKPLESDITNNRPAHLVANKIEALLFLEINYKHGFNPYYLRTQLRESIIDKAPILFHQLRVWFKPNEADKQLILLPNWLHFLYYIIRPFRIAKRFIS